MSSQPIIHVLPPDVSAQIAAGEVVERPASAAKELIENSLDAGATAISVEVRDGGLSLLRVSDDGCGMSRVDAPLALQRFSTSKIRRLADLDAITTLGFRGEALASIAAVARLEILTRSGEEHEGTRVRVVTDQVVVEPAASPVGTSVTLHDLFYNTPARRKFLKSPLREGQLVRETVVRYSLAYPAVAFRLVANGRETYVAPPATPLERIGTALGREVAAEMVQVAWEAADLRIWGHISAPSVGRRDRQGQFFFVNGRPVRAGLLAVMLERPYAGRLPPERRPLGVIHIRLDPHLTDVNVHPRKEEIRLSQERSIYGAVTRAVEEALIPYPHLEQAYPGMAPAGQDYRWPFAGHPLFPPGGGDTGGWTLREEPPAYAGQGLEPLGQVHNAYIVARSTEGLVVVDQHAAHEQVLFERLLGAEGSQPLDPALSVTLPGREAELLTPFLGILADLGWDLEPFGPGPASRGLAQAFLLRALPAPLAGHEPTSASLRAEPQAEGSVEPRALLEALLDELPGCRNLDPEAARERLASKAACTAAIKAGDILTLDQMRSLLRELETAWSPATCPHGRPAFVLLTLEELERRFMRR